jgi:pimeloyl-ACP methyl ester carboxylesterase
MALTASGSERPLPEQALVEGFLELDGARIHYRVDQPRPASGERAPDPYTLPVALLLHGGYMDLHAWDTLAVDLVRSGYRVLRFSDLGHGLTVQGPRPIASVRIIQALLDHLDAPRVSLVGHSWGATMAVDFALAEPQRVDRMVLVAPGLHGWDYFQDSTIALWTEKRKDALAAGDTLVAADWFVRSWVDGPHRSPEDVHPEARQAAAAMIRSNFMRHTGEAWSTLSEREHINWLHQIQAPTLLVTGSLDAEDIHGVTERYLYALDQVQASQVQDLGHDIVHEMPWLGRLLVVPFLEDRL